MNPQAHLRLSAHEKDAQKTGFIWGVGIESSALPHLDVDQLEWTQHNEHWSEDFRLISEELGVGYLRYAIPWHYLEPRPGEYDWSIADERIGLASQLGIELLMDVMHFGTPTWLPQAVGDPLFPEALERFTRAFVARYSKTVRFWCPFNEPLVTSLFSGDFGFWPPYSRKWRGYFPVLSRVALATSRAIRAIRETQPDAVVLLADACEHFTTRDPELNGEVAMRNLRRFLMLDLISGRVDMHHPLHEWVTAYGMSELDLEWFSRHGEMPDVIGLDYYVHSEWELDKTAWGIRQRHAGAPGGLYGIAADYYARYGLPMMVTETSIEGKPINREVWLDRIVADVRRLREEGVPLNGVIWWPLFDHLDWDGAMTHRIGKIHQVGLFRLSRQKDGGLRRVRTPAAAKFARLAADPTGEVGELETLAIPQLVSDEQLPPLAQWSSFKGADTTMAAVAGQAAQSATSAASPTTESGDSKAAANHTGDPGIVVFSHLRWGFVWQRPQQFLSRFARKHPVLFVEEPFFDLPDGEQARTDLHQVMPGVTVAAIHCPSSMLDDGSIPEVLRSETRKAMQLVGSNGDFHSPLLWYYSPLDSQWSLGHFDNSGVIYDCMDELSQFTGAPESLVEAEARLLEHSDIVFTGGRNLYSRKSENHDNVHFFGCGVEADHFGMAMDESTPIPPDIDFMPRPILGWFGVIDERVDYPLLAEIARLRPQWSLAMIGPVVKIDPNLLPHAPNLFWMGGRDYAVLPNYCKAFDICMMCFAINDATEYINPTKALEYLATGRPVISTPVKDVVDQYADFVDIAATAEEWVAAVERILGNPDPDRIRKGLDRARQSSWNATVEKMQALIGDSTGAHRRRSAAAEPLEASRIIRRYQSTPGS